MQKRGRGGVPPVKCSSLGLPPWGKPDCLPPTPTPPPPPAYQTECMNFVKLVHVYNHTHLLACGTGAFHPTCAFVEVGHRLEVRPGPDSGEAGGHGEEGPGINSSPTSQEPMLRLDVKKLEDGKGKSPYDPRHRAASVLVGESKGRHPAQPQNPLEILELHMSRGHPLRLPEHPESSQLPEHPLALSTGEELYSGVAADLMGRDFTIFRSLGQNPSLRTEPHDSRWLNGERLVGPLGGNCHPPTRKAPHNEKESNGQSGNSPSIYRNQALC